MKRHFEYLKYVLRHKWFVFIAGLKVGAPIWQLIIHDWSKFLPSEWTPYAKTFYAPDGSSEYKKHPKFDAAWNHHQNRNKHHWQYWILRRDDGGEICLPIPRRYLLEMVADWMGAGRAITGDWDVAGWYNKNKDKIRLEVQTRLQVESLILPD